MQFVIPLLGLLTGIYTGLLMTGENWCDVQSKYCRTAKHIACEPNQFPTDPNCRNVTLLKLNQTTKNLIVHWHNAYRNEIAAGRLVKFPPASKMGEMAWDDTLQFLAEKHVLHCSFMHDQCRATPEYPRAGQNIAWQGTVNYFPDPIQAIVVGIAGWWNEWKAANPAVVDKLTNEQHENFHFTTMANDKNNRLGCGIIQYKIKENKDDFDAFLFTCDYQYTNVIGEPMYQKGYPVSECTNNKSSTFYPALCAVNK